MDLSYLNNTIPYLTRSEYYHDIPLDSSLYILKDGISSLLTPEKITPQRLSTLGRILSPHNLQKIDFVTIRNIMTYLKLLKHDGVNEITPSAYFVDGCNVLLNILRFNCTTELIHEFISFYKDLSTLHSGFLIDLLRSRHEPSHIYYSFSGIVSFISCSLSVEKIPESCYTFATKVRLKQLHHDAKPCIFAFNTNNYFFSLSVDGHTQTLFLDVNVISSSNNASPNPIGSPSITHVKSSIDTKLKICLNVWNDISLVHYRQTDTLKIISNNKSSNYIEVPYINLREKHIFLSIGGLDGKSNTYLSGDITYLSWNFDQVSPCEKPALYISPKSYSTIPNKSYIKITKTIKNRIITNDVKLTHWTISSATPIYSVISRCVADIFYTFGGVNYFLPLLRCGTNNKVINNVGKLLLFFLKCQLIDVPTTITLLIEVTKIAHDYIVTTSIIDDYLKSCLSFLGRGYCKDVVVYLMIDIRLWSGVDYLFDYLVSELMNKKEMLIKSQLFDVIEPKRIIPIILDRICICDENWKWNYINFLSNWIHPTHFHYLFSLLQDTNIQLPFKENLICLLLCIVKNHPESSIEMNLYIPSLLYIAQQSKRTLIFVLKLFSLLQPSSEQLTQLTNIISFFNVDSILYSSLLQCASGSFQIGFNPILIQTITSLPNQQYLFILFKLLSEQKDISKTITTDLAQFPLVLLRYIPLSFLTTITYTVLNQINYTTTLTPLLINFLLSHEPDASPLLISIIISNSQNSNITYKNSLPILFALLPYLNNIHTLSYIHFFAFASFINYQHPLPEQIILSFLKSVPTDYFSVMSQLRSTNEFKSIFYLHSHILFSDVLEPQLLVILQLCPQHLPASFCQYVGVVLKNKQRLLDLALQHFSTTISPTVYRMVIDSINNLNTPSECIPFKSFFDTIILDYKEINTKPLNEVIQSKPISDVPFPVSIKSNELTNDDSSAKIMIAQLYRRTMRLSQTFNPFFPQTSSKYFEFRTKYLNHLNPIFITKSISSITHSNDSNYENLFSLQSNNDQVSIQDTNFNCYIITTAKHIEAQLTFDSFSCSVAITTKQSTKRIHIDSIREIIMRCIQNKWKGVEIITFRATNILLAFSSEKTLKIVCDKLLSFSEKMKGIQILNKKGMLNSMGKLWADGLLSNYEYLCVLNNIASRSFHNINNYPIFPLINNEKLVCRKEKEHLQPSHLCCLLYSHMPFTRLLPLFQLQISNPPSAVRDIRKCTTQAIPEIYSSQKIYKGIGGSDDGISYDTNKSPTAQSIVFKQRKLLESVEVTKALGEWINLNFGKHSNHPIQNIVIKRKRMIDFSNILTHTSKNDVLKIVKDYTKQSIISLNVERNIVFTIEGFDVIVNEDNEIKTKCLRSSNIIRKICCDKSMNKVIVSYEKKGDEVTITWKEQRKTIRIENGIVQCYFKETYSVIDLELFITNTTGNIFAYKILLDEKNNEIKQLHSFTLYIGDKIKSFDVSTYYGYLVCSTNSSLYAYSLYNGSPLFITPAKSLSFCCSSLGNTYSITGTMLLCYDIYGDIYNYYDINILNQFPLIDITCITCSFIDIVLIATSFHILVLANTTTSFTVVDHFTIQNHFKYHTIQSIIPSPTLTSPSNFKFWDVHVILFNTQTKKDSFITLHIDCFKNISIN